MTLKTLKAFLSLISLVKLVSLVSLVLSLTCLTLAVCYFVVLNEIQVKVGSAYFNKKMIVQKTIV